MNFLRWIVGQKNFEHTSSEILCIGWPSYHSLPSSDIEHLSGIEHICDHNLCKYDDSAQMEKPGVLFNSGKRKLNG